MLLFNINNKVIHLFHLKTHFAGRFPHESQKLLTWKIQGHDINPNSFIADFNQTKNILFLTYSIIEKQTNKTGVNIKLKDQFKALYSEINNIIGENKLGSEYKVALNNRIILNLITVAINYGTTGELNLFKRLHILKNVLADDMYVNAFKNFDFSYLPRNYKIFFFLCKKRSVLVLYLMTNLAMKERDKIKR